LEASECKIGEYLTTNKKNLTFFKKNYYMHFKARKCIKYSSGCKSKGRVKVVGDFTEISYILLLFGRVTIIFTVLGENYSSGYYSDGECIIN